MYQGTTEQLAQTPLPEFPPQCPLPDLLGCAGLTLNLFPAGQVCGAWPLQLCLMGGC
jgi:hypothetical protein